MKLCSQTDQLFDRKWLFITQMNSSRLRAALLNPWNSTKQLRDSDLHFTLPKCVSIIEWMHCVNDCHLCSVSQDCYSVSRAAASPGREEGHRHELLVKDIVVSDTSHNLIPKRKTRRRLIKSVLITHWSTDHRFTVCAISTCSVWTMFYTFAVVPQAVKHVIQLCF